MNQIIASLGNLGEMYLHINTHYIKVKKQRERNRQRQTETDRDRQKHKDTDRQTDRDRKTERDFTPMGKMFRMSTQFAAATKAQQSSRLPVCSLSPPPAIHIV